jgi:hypothetical protein
MGALFEPNGNVKKDVETSKKNPLQNVYQFYGSEVRYVTNLNQFDAQNMKEMFKH